MKKAFRRGVCASQEVLEGEPLRRCAPALPKGEALGTNLSVCFADSSPDRKDSLRPEGDVANSDRGRTTLGRPGKPCCSLGLKLGARQRALFSLEATAELRSTKECWASSRESRQRSPVVPDCGKLCSSRTTTTDSPVAPLLGELASRRRD